MSNTLLILGCGYSGLAIAQKTMAAGWRVIGTGRSPHSITALKAAGLEAVTFDGTADDTIVQAVQEADAILSSIPADPHGDPAFRALEITLRQARPQWVGYLSTTGVYGDRAGRWVFEADELAPSSPRALGRVKAETQWQSLAPSAHVFRLPGIYGPGRSALDSVASSTARSILKPGQVFSRCHRDDIASGVMAALNRPHQGWVFNLCDDEPCPAPVVNDFAATLLGLDPVPRIAFDQADLSEMARQFYADNKRVSNARAKAALGWKPQYPSYREGLRAIFAGR